MTTTVLFSVLDKINKINDHLLMGFFNFLIYYLEYQSCNSAPAWIYLSYLFFSIWIVALSLYKVKNLYAAIQISWHTAAASWGAIKIIKLN